MKKGREWNGRVKKGGKRSENKTRYDRERTRVKEGIRSRMAELK